MRNFLIAVAVFLPAQAFCYPVYRYQARCWVDTSSQQMEDNCTVIETREQSGALRTRNIFSNRFSLTVKSWFDPVRGFMTWDSSNQAEYPWTYKVGSVRDGVSASYVMPGFSVENLPWD